VPSFCLVLRAPTFVRSWRYINYYLLTYLLTYLVEYEVTTSDQNMVDASSVTSFKNLFAENSGKDGFFPWISLNPAVN